MLKDDLKIYLEWDILTWGKALTFWNKILPSSIQGKKVLELGGRHGGLSAYFAKKDAIVICSDLDGPSEHAKELHNSLKLNNISYEKIDATNIPYQNEIDIITFKSVLGGVGYNNNDEAQQRALNSCFNALKPGGILLFAENSTGSFIHQIMRKLFVPWAKNWNYCSRKKLLRMLQTSGFDVEMHSFGFLSLLIPSPRMKYLVYLLDNILNPLIPASSKYINYGIATKKE